jgi:hypothetical protein
LSITFKTFRFGLAGAFVAAVVWIAVTLILPIFVPYLVGQMMGAGGIGGGYVTSNSILLAALIGFVIAFAWKWHRQQA